MAKPYLNRAGRWVYDFVFNRQRHRVRLGRMTERQAMAFAGRLDEVCGQLSGGGGLLAPHIMWLGELDDSMYGRLVGILPIELRSATTLDAFTTQYISSRTKLSQGGRRKLEQTRTKLVSHFGQNAGLRGITRERADAWWKWLRSSLSEATAKTHAGNAKGIFNDAVARRLILESPVAHLPSGSTPREDSEFVEREMVRKVIAASPAERLELKLRLALCRFGGLRVDSEPKSLLWTSVDFAGGRMWFHDQKRKRPRICPIDPELLPYLQERYLERRADEIYVCRKGALNGWNKEQIERAIAAAGVTRWPALFQSLRASYDTEVRMTPEAGDVAADAKPPDRGRPQTLQPELARVGFCSPRCEVGSGRGAESGALFTGIWGNR